MVQRRTSRAGPGPTRRAAPAGADAAARERGRPQLADTIRRLMTERGYTTREVVGRFPERHGGTAYRILAGRTTDPWASTVVELCRALEVDPNELFGAAPPALEPEFEQLLVEASALGDEDRWLIIDLVRAIHRRKAPLKDSQ